MATLTVLEPEGLYPDTALEERVLGPGVRVLQGAATIEPRRIAGRALRRGGRADDAPHPRPRRPARALPAPQGRDPHGRGLRPRGPRRLRRARHPGVQRAGLRHAGGGGVRRAAGARAPPRPAALPRHPARRAARALERRCPRRWCAGRRCRPSASSASAGSAPPRRSAPAPSATAWCSTTRTCRTAPTARSASPAPARWTSCWRSPTCSRSTRP